MYLPVVLRGPDSMGKVLVILKVLPEGVDVDIDSISEKIKTIGVGSFNDIQVEPVAFGLVALKPSFVVEDAGGVSEELESRISEIDGVRSAEVIDATLV